ncbi:hypothetical protein NPIL_613941 [Nephila pilipes]|uniref:Uncharacterized protein n=1 Tax=Nephila pilipes TaxID=299642 RepID=A0A8X6U6I4_NEPPI|nr:hypothetical protein NPIL_613941 [Nephila pilipes]
MSSHPSDQIPLQWCPVYPNTEKGVGSSLRVLPEISFSGKENVSEFLDNIDNNVSYYEITTNLACAYLKDHLIGRTKDWFEDGERSRAKQVETKGNKGLAREESTKEDQWRGKRMRSEELTESFNNHKRQHQSKRRPPGRRNW